MKAFSTAETRRPSLIRGLGYQADHTFVRESLELARRCGAPKRLYACLELFDWGPARGMPGKGRYPLPAEYRQDVVQAIGSGMKGLTSWVYSSAGGWRDNKSLADEVTMLNRLIERIEGELLIGTPIELATSDAGVVMTGNADEKKWPKERVWVGSLLCGPDTIVLAAVNHISASNPEPPKVRPAKDVTITVQVPDFLQKVVALEVTEDGTTPFVCAVADGKAMLKLDAIESGRVFILRRQ